MTTLGRLLEKRGWYAATLARRLGVHPHGVYRLLGRLPPTGKTGGNGTAMQLRTDILEIISADTGIPIGTLVEDAVRAQRRGAKRRRDEKRGDQRGEK